MADVSVTGGSNVDYVTLASAVADMMVDTIKSVCDNIDKTGTWTGAKTKSTSVGVDAGSTANTNAGLNAWPGVGPGTKDGGSASPNKTGDFYYVNENGHMHGGHPTVTRGQSGESYSHPETVNAWIGGLNGLQTCYATATEVDVPSSALTAVTSATVRSECYSFLITNTPSKPTTYSESVAILVHYAIEFLARKCVTYIGSCPGLKKHTMPVGRLRLPRT